MSRTLGGTRLKVSPIGLGCMQFAGRGFVDRIYRAGLAGQPATAVVSAALVGGITWFDTAEMYGSGQADRTLAAALSELRVRGPVTVSTKWNPMLRRASSIARGPDPALVALGEPVVHHIHWPYGSLSSLRSQLRAMAGLYHAGRVNAVGVSNFSVRQLRTAHAVLAEEGVPLATNQVRASMWCRDIETNGMLEAARELDVTLIAYFPLASGLLTGRFHNNNLEQLAKVTRMRRLNGLTARAVDLSLPLIMTLRQVAERHRATPAQVALSWLVTFYGDTVVAIPGASNTAQARANAGAMGVALTEGERNELDDAARWGLARLRKGGRQ